MRRWLSILLLVLLPLQSGWAAVSAYSEHATESNEAHIGHHVHAHDSVSSVAPASANAAEQPGNALEIECGHCHGQCAALPLPTDALVVGSTALGTGIFGIISLGLIGLAIQVVFGKKQSQ